MKVNLIIPAILLMILASSCATSSKIEKKTQKNKVAFKVFDQDKKKIMKVKRNGIVNIEGEKVGILKGDSVLTDLNNDILAYKTSEGLIFSKSQEAIGRIDENAAIEIDASTNLVWTADGRLQLPENRYLRVEPNFQSFYNKTSFLFVVYSAMNSDEESEGNEE